MLKSIAREFWGLSFVALMFAAFFGEASGQTASFNKTDAVERLRAAGEYDSLRAAGGAARKDGGEASRPQISQNKLTSPDGAFQDNFGNTVAISGNTAIVAAPFAAVGANGSQGSVYVFVKNGISWTLQAHLTASDGMASDLFGLSVAIEGDTIVVGSPFFDIPNSNQGAVYVFTRNGAGVWSERQKLLAADGAADDQFGSSVGISGGTIIVGAFSDFVGANQRQGSAYIFTGSGASWTQQAHLIASNGAADDNFGVSASISGDTAIVGAHHRTIGANTHQGAAYIFTRSGTTWTEQAQLTAPDGAANDDFGISSDISGDTAIVGTYYAVGVSVKLGAAYIFVRSGTSWSQQARLTAPDGVPGDYFGAAVAVEGDTAIMSATQATIGANYHQGAAYVFKRSGAAWTQRIKLIAFDGASQDGFGSDVGISGDTAVVGAFGAYVNGVRSGAAYALNITSSQPFDFDGDGRADLSVFRPTDGRWYVLNLFNNQTSNYPYGQAGDVIVPADYDGDGKTDYGIYRGGSWYVLRSSQGEIGVQFGAAGDIPAPADFDGDGRAELVVFRPSNGGWYTFNLLTKQATGIIFGQAGDKPVPADYDGDGKADYAVYRPNAVGGASVWFISRSQLGLTVVTFGDTSDKTAQADYDGDGKTDIAVFRPSTGAWYIQQSTGGFTAYLFGQNGDAPAPADYDGDGKTDIAVFRNGVWYLNRSTAGFAAANFAAVGDAVVPNAYVR